MPSLLLDNDDLSHLENLQTNRSHMVDVLVIQAHEALVAGGKVIIFHTENGQKIEDEIMVTKAELDGFIERRFPDYVKDIRGAVSAILGQPEAIQSTGSSNSGPDNQFPAASIETS